MPKRLACVGVLALPALVFGLVVLGRSAPPAGPAPAAAAPEQTPIPEPPAARGRGSDALVQVDRVVHDRPTLVDKVVFKGVRHLKEDDLRELTGVVAGRPLNPPANKLACKRITAKLNEMGYPFATCMLVKGGEPGEKDVVFEITEGRKVKVRDVRFIGNSFVSSSRLTTQIRSSFVWFHLPGSSYNPQMAEADVNELVKYYRWCGFAGVRVSLETKWEPDGGEVTLVFHINEGPRSRARDTAVKDRTPAIGSAPARVGHIFIEGNTTVSSASILAHVPLYPGQLLFYPDLQEAEKKLAALGLFVVDKDAGVGPTVTVIDGSGESCFKDLLITVKEKPAAKP